MMDIWYDLVLREMSGPSTEVDELLREAEVVHAPELLAEDAEQPALAPDFF